MTTHASRLQVSDQHLWLDVSVYGLRVAEFPLPSVFEDGKDKMCRLSPRRLVGSAFRALCFVRSFRERTDDVRGIVVDF